MGVSGSMLITSSRKFLEYYRIAGKFGGELNLAVWQSTQYQTAKFNLPIRLQWRFGIQPPNLVPTNISSYTVDGSIHHIYGYVVCTGFAESLQQARNFQCVTVKL